MPRSVWLNCSSQIEIKSIRAGGIIGKHEVIFGFPSQTVRMIHESINREAFGNGAVFAINNLILNKTYFIFLYNCLTY